MGEIKYLPVTFLNSLDYILVGPVPVGSLSVAHHLPHHDTEGPDVGAAGELPEGDCLRSGPSDWDLASSGGVSSVNTRVRDLPVKIKYVVSTTSFSLFVLLLSTLKVIEISLDCSSNR